MACWLLLMPTAQSAPADARETARLNNCQPKKLDIYQQTMGSNGSTTYQVECVVAKGKDDAAKSPDALLIRCEGSICTLLRPTNVKQ
ncbi:MAG: hypothetical protein EB121_07775 [Alphaproteobacteria bacterium]|nr:hypothetical protein [Alphaproteobacteria bacterium]